MKKIDVAVADMKEFVPDEMKNTFDRIVDAFKEKNEDNVRAQIKVGYSGMKQHYIGTKLENFQVNVLSSTYTDENGNEFDSKEEYQEYLERAIKDKDEEPYTIKTFWALEVDGVPVDDFSSLEDALKEISLRHDSAITLARDCVIYDENEEEVEHFDDFDEAESSKEYYEEEWIDEKVDELEAESDEAIWNYAWTFPGYSVDHDIAKKCNLVTVEFEDDEGDTVEAITLGGAGMDLSPTIVSYKALTNGFVDNEDVSKFDPVHFDYFKHVVGRETAREVARALGIEHCLYKADVNVGDSVKYIDGKDYKVTHIDYDNKHITISDGDVTHTSVPIKEVLVIKVVA